MFDGHFPGRPILPGVAYLALVVGSLSSMHPSEDPAPSEIRTLRLRRPAGPGDTLELALGGPDEHRAVKFEIRSGEEITAGGTIVSPGRWEEPVSAEARARAPEDAPGGGGPPAFPPPESLIPHGGAMRLVGGVREVLLDGLVCEVRVPQRNPFVRDGKAPCFLLLEAAAQTAAALEALERRRAGSDPSPRLGYLVGARDVRLSSRVVEAGAVCVASVRAAGSAPPLNVYSVSVSRGGRELLQGRISTYIPD